MEKIRKYRKIRNPEVRVTSLPDGQRTAYSFGCYRIFLIFLAYTPWCLCVIFL